MNIAQLYEFADGFGLIRAPAQLVLNEFVSWRESLSRGHGFSVRKLSGQFGDAMALLRPRVMPVPVAYLIWSIDDQWTLFLQNSAVGMDAGPIKVLGRRLGALTVRAAVSEQTRGADGRVNKFGAVIFECFQSGNELRHVYAANDGGRWAFGQAGTPFEFERLNRYDLPLKRERFTAEMLAAYLTGLGVPAAIYEDADFPEVRGYLVSRREA